MAKTTVKKKPVKAAAKSKPKATKTGKKTAPAGANAAPRAKAAPKAAKAAPMAAKTAAKLPSRTATTVARSAPLPAKTIAKSARTAAKAAKKKINAAPGNSASTKPVALADRLDTLLHTVRCIAQHEDELCTLLHAARKSNRTTATLARELRSILANLPAEEYAWELRALEEELDAGPNRGRTPS